MSKQTNESFLNGTMYHIDAESSPNDVYNNQQPASDQLGYKKDLKHNLVRSVPFIVRYINSLELKFENIPLIMEREEEQPKLTPNNLFQALRNGLLLIEIHEKACSKDAPQIIKGVNRKPLTKAVMIKNLEIALRYGWSKTCRATHMCTALDIYLANVPRVVPCLLELMEIWILKQARRAMPSFLTSVNAHVRTYGRSFLPRELDNVTSFSAAEEYLSGAKTEETDGAFNVNVVTENSSKGSGAPSAGGGPAEATKAAFQNVKISAANHKNYFRHYPMELMVPDFADGINLAVVLTHCEFVQPSDLLCRMYGRPGTEEEYIYNLKLLLYYLKRTVPDMPHLLRSPVEWCTPPSPCPETLVAQLFLFYKHVIEPKAKYIPKRIAKSEDFLFVDGIPLYVPVGGLPGGGNTTVPSNGPNAFQLSQYNQSHGRDPRNSPDLYKSLSRSRSPTVLSLMREGDRSNQAALQMIDNEPEPLIHRIKPKTAEEDRAWKSLPAFFRFLGKRCTRAELLEGLSLTSTARGLMQNFKLTPEEVRQVLDEKMPAAETIEMDVFLFFLQQWVDYRKRDEDKNRIQKTGQKKNQIVEFAGNDLHAIYLEDLRRHYQIGKQFYVATGGGKDSSVQEVGVERRSEWDSIPQAEVRNISVTFSKLWDGQTYKCNLYTTVVACRESFRFLLVVRDIFTEQILLKADVGNLQITGLTIRVLNRTNFRGYLLMRNHIKQDRERRKHLMEGIYNPNGEWNTVTGDFVNRQGTGMNDGGPGAANGTNHMSIAGMEGANGQGMMSNSCENPIDQVHQFESGKAWLQYADQDARRQWYDSQKNQGLGRTDNEDLQRALSYADGLHHNDILSEEIKLEPLASTKKIQLDKFLEELRIIAYFLPQRERVPDLDVH